MLLETEEEKLLMVLAKSTGVKGCVADVPAAVRVRVDALDALEGLRPLLGAAVDDGVGQVLVEDADVLVEALAVGLGGHHVLAEAEAAAVELAAGAGASRHRRAKGGKQAGRR